MASVLRAGLAGPCSLRVGALAQEGPGVRLRPVPFLSLNSLATVRLWTGVSVEKKQTQNKSDKIKAIFIWEAESELPTENWALGLHHFSCSWGQCRDPVWVWNQGTTATPHSKATVLHSVLLEPSLLPPTQPGQADEGPQLLGVYIESRLILFYMLLS